MDALESLKEMHVAASAAFAEIEAADPADREELWADLQPQLVLHERIEEQFVYDPVARDAGGSDPVLAAWETEHEYQVHEADAVMDRIGSLDPGLPAWLEAVTNLATTLDGHIAHEETDIWPRIRAAWGDQKLAEAGRHIDAARAAADRGASVQEAVAAAS